MTPANWASLSTARSSPVLMNIGPPGNANALMEESATTSKVNGEAAFPRLASAHRALADAGHVGGQNRVPDDGHLLAYLVGVLLAQLDVLLFGKQIEA